MAVNKTTEGMAMKLTLDYGEGDDGKLITKSKTYSELNIAISDDAFMAAVNAIAGLMEPTVSGQKKVTTEDYTESV